MRYKSFIHKLKLKFQNIKTNKVLLIAQEDSSELVRYRYFLANLTKNGRIERKLTVKKSQLKNITCQMSDSDKQILREYSGI